MGSTSQTPGGVTITDIHFQSHSHGAQFAQVRFALAPQAIQGILPLCEAPDGSYNRLLLFCHQATPGTHRTFTWSNVTPLSGILRILQPGAQALCGPNATDIQTNTGIAGQMMQVPLKEQRRMM